MVSEMDVYFIGINGIEDAIEDDSKFPVIKDNKIKRCCWITLESIKMFFSYIKFNIEHATKKDN